MIQPLLSILIPTVVGRDNQFNKLIYRLNYLCENATNKIGRFTNRKDYDKGCAVYVGKPGGHEVEIMYYRDDKSITIGEKREELYKMATGLFSWMPDDDDDCSDNAIQLILEAIKSNPEIPCITFREKCMMNGEYKSSNHSIKYEKWQDNFDGYDYVRCPFYKDVIRTDIAKSVPFPHIRYNEDEQWSMVIKPLLTNEIHIEEELYYYIYNETNPTERYGLDRQ